MVNQALNTNIHSTIRNKFAPIDNNNNTNNTNNNNIFVPLFNFPDCLFNNIFT